MGEQIKVGYATRAGGSSTAYIDADTGEGTDKHSDLPVIIEWDDPTGEWRQTDNWEWRWAGIEFVRVDTTDA